MSNQFHIKGCQYCRYLDFFRDDTKCTSPDLLVVIMDIVLSLPVDGIENNKMDFIAILKKIQDKIEDAIISCDHQYIRILSFTDLCETNDGSVLNESLKPDNESFLRAVLEENQQVVFNHLWVQNVPVIYIWIGGSPN